MAEWRWGRWGRGVSKLVFYAQLTSVVISGWSGGWGGGRGYLRRVWGIHAQEACVSHLHQVDEGLTVVQAVTLICRQGVASIDDAQGAGCWDLVLGKVNISCIMSVFYYLWIFYMNKQ